MNIAFLTEIGYDGKFPPDHPNARTEVAWMVSLNAIHYNIWNYNSVNGYDVVFVIIPKGDLNLNIFGSELVKKENVISSLLTSNFVEVLKSNNKKVCFVQEGPTNLVNDYTLVDQFNYYNQLQNFDIIFAHNKSDTKWYRGLFPNKQIETIPSLMIENLISGISWKPENKVMIGGNFCRWYGGFQSYIVASELNAEMWIQTSHATRDGENQIEDLKVLPRVSWMDWIKTLSSFKYGVNMMPTVAAGTFSLNCAYFGIPCIGNKKLDTQNICHPNLSVDVEDVESAVKLAQRLYSDREFYNECSTIAKNNYNEHWSITKFIENIKKSLNE
jgi:hypothetical protein